jgi:hypothetical protein
LFVKDLSFLVKDRRE